MKRLSTLFFATAFLLAGIVLAALVGRAQDAGFGLERASAATTSGPAAPAGPASRF